ncbi:TetR/AcrR family transcriptional regulator [Mitsuaria sp. WAJ17]|uniref:TetR/AcrR family transcriptional regulator n=1 Tax=Mitsuaria sp. WAJ17 TaxID=2761452 RepID=UPI0016016A8A|nr:TetR/AcrR family transcriptional regulator [Mitsuaria sp. WAJ17]MBB2485330.1 TetR/AcrR family transcriptional regulator [Mitsuaria sp. WAJ17]
MKVKKERARENFQALLEAAGKLFRLHGIDAVSVTRICQTAGLSSSALHSKYASKEDLAADAVSYTIHTVNRFIADGAGAAAPSLSGQLDYFLSVEHRDDLASGCAMTALVSEIGRMGPDTSERFAQGFSELVDIFQESLLAGSRDTEDRATAMTLVGSVSGARAVAKGDPKLSDELLRHARRMLGGLAREHLMAGDRGDCA